MLIFHRQHDITNRERAEELHAQSTSVRSDWQTSVTETKHLVSTKFGTVRSGIEEATSTMALRQEGLQNNLRIGTDELR